MSGSVLHQDRILLPLRLGLSALLLLEAAAAWLPGPALWGFNHLAWLPAPWRILVPLAGFAAVWTPVGRWLGGILAGGRGAAFLERRALAYGVAPALGGLVFFLLQDRVHLLGDGATLADNLAKGVIFHGFDFMTYFLYAQAFQWLGAGPESQAYSVMAWGSILSGAVYVGAAAWAARRLECRPAGRSLLFGLLVSAPILQIFMGYAEVYAPLAVALMAFAACLCLDAEGKAPLWWAGAAWAVAL
ncbi:hypothetical protein KJ682_00120, partial [bacterium]|nr:hypothetical protein [bacterium]